MTCKNDSPALESRRVRTQPSMVTWLPVGTVPCNNVLIECLVAEADVDLSLDMVVLMVA